MPPLSLPSLPRSSPCPCPPVQGPISAQARAISPCLCFPGSVSVSRSATALPLRGHRAGWSSPSGGRPQEKQHPPQVSWSPQAPCGTSCWQKPPSKPAPALTLKLGVETQSCTAADTMFQLKCKKKPKAFPPALSATATGLTSASCSPAETGSRVTSFQDAPKSVLRPHPPLRWQGGKMRGPALKTLGCPSTLPPPPSAVHLLPVAEGDSLGQPPPQLSTASFQRVGQDCHVEICSCTAQPVSLQATPVTSWREAFNFRKLLKSQH